MLYPLPPLTFLLLICFNFPPKYRINIFGGAFLQVKRGVGAKHSDIEIYAFSPQLSPECFSPTGWFAILIKLEDGYKSLAIPPLS